MLSEKTLGRGEEGEFELILGNRQLLSVFFIVVVLLGVFFTMGYIVGKNSVTAGDIAANQSQPITVDPARPSVQEAAKPSPVPPRTEQMRETIPPPRVSVEPTPVPAAPVEPPVTRERETRRPDPPKAAAKAEPKPEVKPEPKPAPAAKPAGASVTPQSGQQFLQVVATSKPDAEIIASVLRRQGFNSAVVPGPNEKLFRVVVGPLPDASTISKTRSDLEAAGFQKPILKRF